MIRSKTGIFIEADFSKDLKSVSVTVSEAENINGRIRKAYSPTVPDEDKEAYISILTIAIRSIIDDSAIGRREALLLKTQNVFGAVFSDGLTAFESMPSAS